MMQIKDERNLRVIKKIKELYKKYLIASQREIIIMSILKGKEEKETESLCKQVINETISNL